MRTIRSRMSDAKQASPPLRRNSAPRHPLSIRMERGKDRALARSGGEVPGFARLALGALLLIALVAGFALAGADARPALAQGGGEFPLPEGVTWDQVNNVAREMYCDVCEGVPLDECESVACRQWREEIARQLAEGRSKDEIIDYFVERYGGDVAAIPRDTGDRLLAFAIPIVIVAIIGGLGFVQVRRLRERGQHAGQVVRRSSERLQARPVPDDVDPLMVERLERELEGLES